MVAARAGGFIDGTGIAPSELEVGTPPDNEEGGGLGQTMEAGEIDAEAVLDVQAPGGGDQGLGEVGVNAPVAFLVGIGERGTRDTPPRMPKW